MIRLSPLPASLPLLLLLAACTAPRRVAPPQPAPPPPSLAPPTPSALDWRDAPVAAGGWHYARRDGGSVASFGIAGAPVQFELRCDTARHVVALRRYGAGAGPMTITTSSGPRTWPAAAQADGAAAVTLGASDPFLDQFAFSRARVAIEAAGVARLILPNWAEPSRVIEDCRA